MNGMIAYGVFCTWHDDKSKVGVSGGIPCCPHCKRILYEMPKQRWLEQVAKHNAANPGYARMMVWAKGKCFENYGLLKQAYEMEGSP